MNFCLIIINYNGMKFLPKYLEKIRDECVKYNIKLIISDDNSTDGSIEYLLNNGYDVTVNLGKNKGFAANVNNGVLYAKKLEAYDYFIISNNDIEFKINFLSYFLDTVRYINATIYNCGLIGIKEVNIWNLNDFLNFNPIHFDISNIKIVKSIPGFFLAINNKLINKIGLFDEDYFMYGEDNDYFYRTNKQKFEIVQIDFPALHMSEGSSTNQKKTSWYVYRNSFLFAQKNLSYLETIKLFCSFINQIYNPFLKNSSPSSIRIRRNGFIENNYMLIKSIFWNIKFFIKNKKQKK